MKAILVVDIPEDYTGSVISVNLYGRNNKLIHENHINKLRPLPKEFSTSKLSEDEQDSTKLITETAIMKVYADGWNDCLKEINETKKTT